MWIFVWTAFSGLLTARGAMDAVVWYLYVSRDHSPHERSALSEQISTLEEEARRALPRSWDAL